MINDNHKTQKEKGMEMNKELGTAVKVEIIANL